MRFLLFLLWFILFCFFVALSLVPHLVSASAETDKILHVLAYSMLTTFPVCYFRSWRIKISAAALLFLTGIMGEILQNIIGGRTGSINDIIANTCGIALGFLIAALLRSGWAATPRIATLSEKKQNASL